MKPPRPTYRSRDGRVTVYAADAADVLPAIEDNSIDLVLTDPPYMIGATSVGNRKKHKTGSWADMVNAAAWYADWMSHAERILHSAGYLMAMTNWRGLPTAICALARAGITASSCAVWDKQHIGPAGPRQLRPCYELVVMAAMHEGRIPDRRAADVIRVPWCHGNKHTGHPAEKPVELMRHLIGLPDLPASAAILDPFAGSGTTGVAALDLGHRIVACEADPAYVGPLIDRLKAAATATRPRKKAA